MIAYCKAYFKQEYRYCDKKLARNRAFPYVADIGQ